MHRMSNSEAVRRHYSSRATPNEPGKVSGRLKLSERASGPAYPLKRFHNEVKRSLLQEFAQNSGRLLDLACGRGGDIHKWAKMRIKYVLGVDLSGDEIAEAHRRFEEAIEANAGNKNYNFLCEFKETDKLGLEPCAFGQEYDIVTCMFAIHYFFENENIALTFLSNVADNLKNGGYFLGCFPEGKRVLKTLNQKDTIEKGMFKIKKLWRGEPKCFGSGYCISITNTVVETDSESSLVEYLVFFNVLVELARKVHLYPILKYRSAHLNGLFEDEDIDQPFKHFNASYPGSDESLEETSSLYVSFAFQKRLPNLPPPPDKRRGDEVYSSSEEEEDPKPQRRGGDRNHGKGSGGMNGGRGFGQQPPKRRNNGNNGMNNGRGRNNNNNNNRQNGNYNGNSYGYGNDTRQNGRPGHYGNDRYMDRGVGGGGMNGGVGGGGMNVVGNGMNGGYGRYGERRGAGGPGGWSNGVGGGAGRYGEANGFRKRKREEGHHPQASVPSPKTPPSPQQSSAWTFTTSSSSSVPLFPPPTFNLPEPTDLEKEMKKEKEKKGEGKGKGKEKKVEGKKGEEEKKVKKVEKVEEKIKVKEKVEEKVEKKVEKVEEKVEKVEKIKTAEVKVEEKVQKKIGQKMKKKIDSMEVDEKTQAEPKAKQENALSASTDDQIELAANLLDSLHRNGEITSPYISHTNIVPSKIPSSLPPPSPSLPAYAFASPSSSSAPSPSFPPSAIPSLSLPAAPFPASSPSFAAAPSLTSFGSPSFPSNSPTFFPRTGASPLFPPANPSCFLSPLNPGALSSPLLPPQQPSPGFASSSISDYLTPNFTLSPFASPTSSPSLAASLPPPYFLCPEDDGGSDKRY